MKSAESAQSAESSPRALSSADCADSAELVQHRERVDFMLRTVKTKAELQDLVRTFDARNVRLHRVRDQLGTQLALARLDAGKARTAGAENDLS